MESIAGEAVEQSSRVSTACCSSAHLRLVGLSCLTFNGPRYTLPLLIRSFKDKEAERIFAREFSRKLPQDIQQVALRKLRMLNRATTLNDLRVPSANRLEKLTGERAGQYSVRINDQWRVCFDWRDGDAYNVEIVDYH